ncbi:HopJ type III effector protein [Methylomonas paludis]|uniref:HopJ type III effector protein n=1 Tax=Methylomonas paludis TaxID=1173101 RepID=A0A975MLN8_9GAMM|nr:HopJ type III effector protein [Methylomonas paludis]QWF70156.1 HopJ type III effector protein [Methylomonas paludis]
MAISDLLQRVKNGESVDFQESIAVIDQAYRYQPTEFSNGLVEPLLNQAGQNEGSCKIFAFAKLHGLNQTQTLALFGDYYRQDVLGNPNGSNHLNIRRFMRDGWDGMVFSGVALQARAE